MEKTTRTLSGRSQLSIVPPSPRLVRCRSGSSPAAITTPDRSSRRFSSSERFINNGHRSKSTSKLRTHNNEENINPKSLITSISSVQTKFQEKKSKDGGFGKFLQRGVSPDNNTGTSKRATLAVKLPSAWALSPGRSLGSPIGSERLIKANGSGGGGGRVGGGVTKVLKYFKQRKVSSVQEEEYHRFRILHNRLLQWRFINARAEVAMATVKNVTEIQLFSVWIRILVLRKIIIQKRIEMQKIKHMIKLYEIINLQLPLLNEWAKLEKRNQESIGRLTRKLSALSTTLPLTHGLKADTDSVYEALNTAVIVMRNMEPLITKYQTQVEKILYQVTELTTATKQEEEYLQELLAIVPMIASLLDNEKSIRVHLIQAKMESNTVNDASKTTLSDSLGPFGSITRTKARRYKEALNGLIQELVANQGVKEHSRALDDLIQDLVEDQEVKEHSRGLINLIQNQ